jgi:CRP-like cAMP-binding protein
MVMSRGTRPDEAGRADILDWLHEQGKRRDARVPEFDAEKTLRLVRAVRDADTRNFWSALTPTEREAFTSVAHEQNFRKGAALMREGEPSNDVMVILDGQTKVIVDDGGRDRIIARRGPGDLVGESGAAPGNVRSATVVALGMVRTLVMTTEDYAAFVGEHFGVSDILKRHVKGR